MKYKFEFTPVRLGDIRGLEFYLDKVNDSFIATWARDHPDTLLHFEILGPRQKPIQADMMHGVGLDKGYLTEISVLLDYFIVEGHFQTQCLQSLKPADTFFYVNRLPGTFRTRAVVGRKEPVVSSQTMPQWPELLFSD